MKSDLLPRKHVSPRLLESGLSVVFNILTKPLNVAMKKYVPPTDEEIACCAFAIISRENPMLADSKWREAEAQLIASRKHDAGLLRKRTDSIQLHRTLCAA